CGTLHAKLAVPAAAGPAISTSGDTRSQQPGIPNAIRWNGSGVPFHVVLELPTSSAAVLAAAGRRVARTTNGCARRGGPTTVRSGAPALPAQPAPSSAHAP